MGALNKVLMILKTPSLSGRVGVGLDRTQKSFLVPKADIIANDYDLSINRYKEVVYEEVQYEKPITLIQDIKTLQRDNAKKLLDLEKMLG